MTHGSLFSGIGGFDLASEWMGWHNIFHCEFNPFCQKILRQYWPAAISYNDIKETDFTPHYGAIDVLTGGFPCQPYSTAGRRKGKDDERHLWPEMLRAIREIRPRWILGENVRGLISWNDGLVFDEVQSQLEAEGYEVFPVVLPAAGINAPHQRYRIWFIAYSIGARLEEQQCFARYDGTKQSPFKRDANRWGGWPTQSPVCGRNDGVPNRVDRTKALGNAIVPQVAYEIFQNIAMYEMLY